MPDQTSPPQSLAALRILVALGAVWALAVVVLGAYVRLKDAGLGCPDWPGCYGQLIGVPVTDAHGAPIDRIKAAIEVAHRYLAGALGLLIVAVTVCAWRAALPQRALALALLVAVALQGALGALTVTELLKPLIVTAHLIGGLTVLALLVAFAVRLWAVPGFAAAATPGRLKWVLALASACVAAQIALGGWVSTNYAGLSCGASFPSCAGLTQTDASAFALNRSLGRDAAGAPLPARALATVQWVHRLGAAAAAAAVIVLAAALLRYRRALQAILLILIFFMQSMLGIYIATAGLPLPAALLHNAGAALLCATLAACAGSAAAAAK